MAYRPSKPVEDAGRRATYDAIFSVKQMLKEEVDVAAAASARVQQLLATLLELESQLEH